MEKTKKRQIMTVILSAFLIASLVIPGSGTNAAKKKTIYVITKETCIQGKHKSITSYKYNKNGLLTEARAGKKASQKIKYNKNRISQMTTSEGKTKQTVKYIYNKKGKVQKILFKNGNGKYETIVVLTYNNKGVLTKYKDWGHGNITLFYNGSNVSKSVDGNGVLTTYTYDDKQNIKKWVTKYEDESDFREFTIKYNGNRITQRIESEWSSDDVNSKYKEIYKYTTKKITVPASRIKQIKKQQRKLINQVSFPDPELYDFGQIAFHM